jgi:hypothetical protein
VRIVALDGSIEQCGKRGWLGRPAFPLAAVL